MINTQPEVCNLCGGKVIYTSNARVYHGREYGSGYCYLCLAVRTLERISLTLKKHLGCWQMNVCGKGKSCAMLFLTPCGKGKSTKRENGMHYIVGWLKKWQSRWKTATSVTSISNNSGKHTAYSNGVRNRMVSFDQKELGDRHTSSPALFCAVSLPSGNAFVRNSFCL